MRVCVHTFSTAYLTSPLGVLAVQGTAQAIIAVRFLEPISAPPEPDPASVPAVLQQALAELRAYFAGMLQTFSVPLVLQGTPFQVRVWQAVRAIPFGETRSYQAIAQAVGARGAVRAVGAANGSNPLPILVPCHRVIGSDGSLVGYGGGLWRKRWLLAHEGHPIQARLFDL